MSIPADGGKGMTAPGLITLSSHPDPSAASTTLENQLPGDIDNTDLIPLLVARNAFDAIVQGLSHCMMRQWPQVFREVHDLHRRQQHEVSGARHD